MIYYTAGRAPLRELYNIQTQRELQTVEGSPFPVSGGVMPYNHTPIYVPLLHLLVDEDYVSSYLRWTVVLWLAALGCALVVFKMTDDLALAFAALSFYPNFVAILRGHDTILLLLGALLCAHLLSIQKDWLAGIALSLTTIKPHIAIFLALPIIWRPKAFLSFCAASTILALYSVLLVGVSGVSDFLELIKISAAGEVFGMHPLDMYNLLGLMERAGIHHDVARPVAWLLFFLSAMLMLVAWKRSPSNPPFALTMLLAVVMSPHLHQHDLALLLVTFVTLSNPKALFLLVSSLALAGPDMVSNQRQFAVSYLLMVALLAVSIKDLRFTRNAT